MVQTPLPERNMYNYTIHVGGDPSQFHDMRLASRLLNPLCTKKRARRIRTKAQSTRVAVKAVNVRGCIRGNQKVWLKI